jgi:hypothetical protein
MIIVDPCTGTITSVDSDSCNCVSDKTYEHSQPIASTTWTIPHGMGKRPSVQTFDASLEEIEGCVSHIDDNTVVVEFNTAVSGVAYLN